jgi:hypothetical protein
MRAAKPWFYIIRVLMLTNNITKKPFKQRKSRAKLIEAAQSEWCKDAEKLAGEKADLGYKDFSVDAFLEVLPDDLFDTVAQSKIIALQDEYRALIEHQEFIRAEDLVIEELNKTHAVVHIDQTYILTEKINTIGWRDFSLEGRQSFKTYYEDENIVCIDGIERSKADIWLKSSKRRKYKGIIFDPTTELKNESYNLWKGFAKKSQQGNCSKYWEHIKENICSGDQEAYLYLRKWLAYIFQHPDIVHTALVLCGSQGVGKNSFVEPLGVLLGSHYAPLSSITELVSNFNYHLKNAVLIHANEALWGGNKKEIGTVKAMITEQNCLIEGKGKDRIVVKNFKHVILSSNEDWPVHLDPDDRRFFVLRVSEQRKEDHEYFKAIQKELNNGGYEALLYDLLHEDLSDFNPRKMPENSDSFSIKIRSAESPHRYLFDVLSQGGFSIGGDFKDDIPVWHGTGPIPKDSVFKDYVSWCENNGEAPTSKELFCRVIKKIIASVEDARPGGGQRVRCYKFPNLQQTREEFCKSFKEKPERIFKDDETGQ